MNKLCFVATIPAVVHTFLREHIQASAAKWSVKVVSSPQGAELLNDLHAEFIPLEIERNMSPLKDLLSLIRLMTLFRRERFDLIHSIMPKSGFLTMLAACLVGVPIRMHTFTGQVWATRRGWKRSLLKMFDKMTVAFATHILVDSPSQRDFLVSEGVLPRGKGVVIGKGSICGVDVRRFHPDARMKDAVRKELGIGLQQVVLLFLGRLNRDKGVLDLAMAFQEVARYHTEVALVLVGAEEDVPYRQMQEICGEHRGKLYRVGFTTVPERYMAMADLFCLPSYREGFGQVIIEAAACGIPTIATRIYGITDAIEDGRTGLLVAPGDVAQLVHALRRLIKDSTLRRSMGEAARIRVVSKFDSEDITKKLIQLYEEVMW